MSFYHKLKRTMTQALVLAVTGGLIACSEKSVPESQDAQAHDDHGEKQVVMLSPAQLQEFGIEVGVARPGSLKVHRKLAGEVTIEPDRLAHIVPRFPGMVKEVRKHIGDPVRKGEILAIIESNESLAPYEVKSLIAGTVTDKHLSLGEVITDDSHAFTITDLSSVWVNLSVYQKDLPFIKLGQRVVISAGPEPPEATGKISYISPLLDEATRTANARVVLANPDGRWRPGLFVTGYVEVSSEPVAVIAPRSALETVDGQEVVFVKTGEGFVPSPVTLGRKSLDAVEVRSGLAAGEQFVTKGGFTLKAELAKSTFGSDEH